MTDAERAAMATIIQVSETFRKVLEKNLPDCPETEATFFDLGVTTGMALQAIRHHGVKKDD